jgi:hypothetical protein
MKETEPRVLRYRSALASHEQALQDQYSATGRFENWRTRRAVRRAANKVTAAEAELNAPPVDPTAQIDSLSLYLQAAALGNLMTLPPMELSGRRATHIPTPSPEQPEHE